MITSDFSKGKIPLMPYESASEKIEKSLKEKGKFDTLNLKVLDHPVKDFAFNKNSDLPSPFDQIKGSTHLGSALCAILGFGALFGFSYYLSSTIFSSAPGSLVEKITDISNDPTDANSSVLWPIMGVAGTALLATALLFAQDRSGQNNLPSGPLTYDSFGNRSDQVGSGSVWTRAKNGPPGRGGNQSKFSLGSGSFSASTSGAYPKYSGFSDTDLAKVISQGSSQ